MTINLATHDLKAFVPAKDFATSKQFYTDLGFKLNWEGDKLAEFLSGNFSFLLQDYYTQPFAENFMLSLTVENVDELWKQIEDSRLAEKYPTIKLKAPEWKPWGLYTLHLIDPSGVLWHIADQRKK